MLNIAFLAVVYSFGDETLRGNCSISQLTSIGFNQQKTNGQNLAQAYVDGTFLSKTLDPTQLYLRSDGQLHYMYCALV